MHNISGRYITIFFFWSFFALAACDTTIPTNIDIVTHVILLDGQGRNLLSPQTPGFFSKEDIRIFYLRNGIREEVLHPNYTWPRNFDIIQNNQDDFAMVIVPDEKGENGDITSTIIQWNDQDEDTLNVEIIRFRKTTDVTSISKIWFNDILAYDDRVNGKSQWGSGVVDRLITVTK